MTSRLEGTMSSAAAERQTPETDAGPGRATVLLETVFPDASNHYGTLFGGHALSLMGRAAYMAASRRAGCNVVMAATDAVRFHRPVPVGHLLELTARVVRTGRSSLTVQVDGVSEAPAGGPRHDVLSGRFEMVAVDAHGRPRPFDAGRVQP
ncbi:acyl-CoA thioesterase [Rhodospirillum centenum]|nr:acyl-CoA thioesterase [Rhodospirillum centenum]